MRLWLALAFFPAVFCEDPIEIEPQYRRVTCGSAIKLRHAQSQHHLHSHGINWGSGSGQQSVTGMNDKGDPNSLWTVREAYGTESCKQGASIPCGTVIRFLHSKTNKFLHSHLHRSPLSARQEVSAYGDGNAGHSDTGDNWQLECAGQFWTREQPFSLLHIDTHKRLFTHSSNDFNNNNCRGCPIIGQLEISCHGVGQQDQNAKWVTADGIYFADPTASTEEEEEEVVF